MPDPINISLKTFMDASEVSNGNTTLAVNKDGNLMASLGSVSPSAAANSKVLSAFMGALTKNFGPHVATAASEQFRADLGGNRPLTGRMVQAIVSEAKFCIERNAMVRNGFITPDKTGISDFDRAFAARINPELQGKISSELQKELKGRIMAELLEKFHSKGMDTVTVEAMQQYVLHDSSLLQVVEKVCTDGTETRNFAFRSDTLDVYLDQQGGLVVREVKPAEREAPLRDPAPGIADPNKAFDYFLSTTPLFSGFSAAQTKTLKAELAAEFKTLAGTCTTTAETRAMLTEFANNKKKSRTLDILADISTNPCRGFTATPDDKVDIARILHRTGDKVGMQVAMERLADIRTVQPNGPITKEAIWQGIFKEPLPRHLDSPFAEAFGQKYMTSTFDAGTRPMLVALMHNLISSADIPTLLRNPHLPVTEKNLHTQFDLSVNSLTTGTDALGADLHRRGGENGGPVPSTITIGSMKLTVGNEPKLGEKAFVFKNDSAKDKYTAGQPSEVVEFLSEAIHNLCGRDGRTAQREMVETLCSQSGLLPLTRMRTALGFAINEHSPSTITIDKTASGAVRVHIATPKTIPGKANEAAINYEVQKGSIDVSWLVEPDGKLSLEQFTIVRPGADAEQRPAAPLSLADVVHGRIAAHATGLNEQNRNELANLVIEAVKSKGTNLPDPMLPRMHPGPLMRVVDGVRSGLFTGPNANENYATLRRFPSFVLPVGLLLDAANRARQAQPGSEITREALWYNMYPNRQVPECASDAEMVSEMENSLPGFESSEVERMLVLENRTRRASGQPTLTDDEWNTALTRLRNRLHEALNLMPTAVAREFVAHPHALRKEDLLTPNMAAQPGFQYNARTRLAEDILRRGVNDGGTPTLNINQTTFVLGAEPKRNSENFFKTEAESVRYRLGQPSSFSRELIGEIRTLCGGQQASQAQVDTVARCCSQCGSSAFINLSRIADFAFNEHSSTNIAVSAEPDGNVRVHISTLPEQADKGSIAYSILVDPTGHIRVDDFIAIPAGVARP